MANQTIITKGQDRIETSLPDVQTVQHPVSTTATNLQIAGNLATEGYKGYVLNDANRRSQEIVQQLDGTLQDIEDAQSLETSNAIGASITNQINELADKDPRLATYAASMGAMNNAIQQRKGAKRLYELKAEAALRETVSKAPGLRAEITQIAARNLGFDPTSATINAILRGIDQEKTTDTSVADNWYHKDMVGKLVAAGVAVPPEVALGGDTQSLVTLFNQVNTAQGNIDQIKNTIETGSSTVSNSISDLQTNFTAVISGQMTPLMNSLTNSALSLQTEEDFLQFQSELTTGSAAARQSITNNVRNFYGTIKTNSPEERRLLEDAANVTVANINSMFDGVLNQNNLTNFQNRAKSLQFLRDSLGVDMLTSNRFLSELEAVSPGITSNLGVQVLAGNPAAYQALRNQISASFDSLSAGDPRRRVLESRLKVLENYRAFSDVSEDDRENVVKGMPHFLDGYMKIFDSDPTLLTPNDYKSAGNAAAAMMQLSSQYAGSDWDLIAKMGAKPGFQHLISELEKGDEDSKTIAGIVSSSYNEAVLNTVRRTIPDGAKGMNIVIDLESGTVSNKTEGRAPATRRGPAANLGTTNYSATMAHNVENRAQGKVDELNNYITTVYNNRHLDPTIKDLDKGQIAHLVASSLRGTAGFNFIGSVTPYNLGQEERERRVSLRDTMYEQRRALEGLSELGARESFSAPLEDSVQSFEQLQETLRNLDMQRLQAQQQLEALKQANR